MYINIQTLLFTKYTLLIIYLHVHYLNFHNCYTVNKFILNRILQSVNNVVIPSIYLLEKNNTQQYILNKNQVSTNHRDIHLDLKLQLLNAIYCIIKDISGLFDILCSILLNYYFKLIC